jgi:hypothetical protein
MEAEKSSETLMTYHITLRRRNSESHNFNISKSQLRVYERMNYNAIVH